MEVVAVILWHLFLLISVPVKPSKDSFKCHSSFEEIGLNVLINQRKLLLSWTYREVDVRNC
jgi:hypothetical protein